MVLRAFYSIVLGLAFAAVALIAIPDLGRVASPMVCRGDLAHEFRAAGLRYHCVAADGKVSEISTDRVIILSVPILGAFLVLPVYALLARSARRAQAAQGAMHNDLATAITARAEILRIARTGNLKRQLLVRAAELRLVLWVHPPNGRPYEATVSWLVEEHSLGRLSIGSIIPVQINPRRPEKVYPAQPWAHFAWWS
jgi:hypothetical protein